MTRDLINIALVLEFEGTGFNGWQAQDFGRTVQNEMERAILAVTGETVRVTGCSRTDAGVHASCYVMNFRTASAIPPDRIKFPLNNVLPADIRIRESFAVPPEFHARKHARAKTYCYRFINSDTDLAVGRQYVAQEKGELDFAAIGQTLELFRGTHDFRAFRSTGSSVQSTTRTIYDIRLERQDRVFTLTVSGDGFLYNMVRIIAGTLFYVGHGTRTLEEVREALMHGDRLKAGRVAPARGLMLEGVAYDPQDIGRDGNFHGS